MKKSNKSKITDNLYVLIAPPLVLLLFFFFKETTLFQQMENLSIDWRFQVRAKDDEKPDQRLVLVGIDDYSLDKYKDKIGKWPWPRHVHGTFLKYLEQFQPAVVAYDIFFTEPTQRHPEDDDLFGEGMKGLPAVITGGVIEYKDDVKSIDVGEEEKIRDVPMGKTPALPNVKGDIQKLKGDDYALVPIKPLRENGLTGFVNVDPSEVDGMRRWLPMVVRLQDKVYPSLVAQSIIQYFRIPPEKVEIVLGEAIHFHAEKETYSVPINEKGEMYVNYRNRDGFEKIPFSEMNNYLGVLYNEKNYRKGVEDAKAEIAGLLGSFETQLAPIKQKIEELKKATAEGVEGAEAQLKEQETTLASYNSQKDEYLVMKNQTIADYEKKLEVIEGFKKRAIHKRLKSMENQVLLLGQYSLGLSDFGPTPLHAVSPLVLVHANAFNNILQGDFLSIAKNGPIVIAWLIVAWVSLFALRNTNVFVSISIPLALMAFYVAWAFLAFKTKNLQLPLLWPALSFTLVHIGANVKSWIEEQKVKNNIKGMFGSYVSRDLVDQMVDSGEEPSLGGESTEITAFFSDVQSFSTFSELLTSPQLVELMNEYLTAMTDILQEEKGTLDKYIGDAIVAMYGAPIPMDDHAYRSVRTAVRMYHKQIELRKYWADQGDKWPPVVSKMQTRIGMNTGIATVGNMGAKDRFNYTMMGDMVNLAARCESGAKAFGAYIMITEDTKVAAEKSKDDILYRFLDKIIVKGRSQPVPMYEVMGFKDELTQEVKDSVDLSHQATEKYLAQDWDAAIALWEKASTMEMHRPGVTPGVKENLSTIFMDRCREMKEAPPGDEWDGVYVMTSK